MPRFKTHAIVGAGVGFAAYCVKHSLEKNIEPDRQFDLGRAVIWAGVGMAGACLPDLLEPAINPNHRGICHSFAVLIGLLWLPFIVTSGTVATPVLLLIAGLGYASHLILDALTPRCLPWI